MADHVIVQVRDAIIARLKAAATAAGTRIYAPHEIDVEDVDTTSPFGVVEIGPDQDERIATGSGADPASPQILEDINLVVFVHCIAKLDGDTEKTALNLRGECEASLLGTAAGLTLGGLVQMVTRVGGSANRDQAIDQEVFNAGVQLEVKIRHLESLPTSFVY